MKEKDSLKRELVMTSLSGLYSDDCYEHFFDQASCCESKLYQDFLRHDIKTIYRKINYNIDYPQKHIDMNPNRQISEIRIKIHDEFIHPAILDSKDIFNEGPGLVCKADRKECDCIGSGDIVCNFVCKYSVFFSKSNSLLSEYLIYNENGFQVIIKKTNDRDYSTVGEWISLVIEDFINAGIFVLPFEEHYIEIDNLDKAIKCIVKRVKILSVTYTNLLDKVSYDDIHITDYSYLSEEKEDPFQHLTCTKLDDCIMRLDLTVNFYLMDYLTIYDILMFSLEDIKEYFKYLVLNLYHEGKICHNAFPIKETKSVSIMEDEEEKFIKYFLLDYDYKVPYYEFDFRNQKVYDIKKDILKRLLNK